MRPDWNTDISSGSYLLFGQAILPYPPFTHFCLRDLSTRISSTPFASRFVIRVKFQKPATIKVGTSVIYQISDSLLLRSWLAFRCLLIVNEISGFIPSCGFMGLC